DFARTGVSTRRIQRSLERLRQWLPSLGQCHAALAKDGQILVRLEDGRLADARGQGVFDFCEEPLPTALPMTTSSAGAADAWFHQAWEFEQAGTLEQAAGAYREALLAGGPDAITCFNLGNVLFQMGHKEQAAERLQQAVEIDPRIAEAWNNLGNVLSDL